MKFLTIIVGFWYSLPVMVRAVLTGFVITSAGTIPWAVLVSLNLKYWPELPWAVPLTALYMWFFWKYVRGAGWPQATAEARRKNCRAYDLSSDAWAAAIGAGILGLWSLVLFQSVYGRMVNLPTRAADDFSGVPLFTLFSSFIMSAVVAGLAEESGLRGYMQRPLEERHGPVVAILVTGTIFGFMHFTHTEVTMVLMPWYMGIGLVYGGLAYLTKSIMPGVVLHAGGNILGALQFLVSGQTEWQTGPQPTALIWESGTDTMFWIASLGFMAVTTAAIWAYSRLAKIKIKQSS